MGCEDIRQFLLEFDWNASRRQQALESLRHLEQCDTCRAAVHDFDELRLALAPAQLPEPLDGWEAMQRRLVRTIPPARNNWIRPALAMAAMVVLALMGFQLGRRATIQSTKTLATANNPRVETDADPTAPGVSPRELSHAVQAFRAISEVYDGRAGWMVVSHENSDIGILAGPVSSTARTLIFRLSLWQGDASISNADLVVLAGQTADVTLPLTGARSLHYRVGTSMDDPTQLTVGLELRIRGLVEPMAALATKVRIQPGQKQSVGRLATTAGEYELKIIFAGAAPAYEKP